MLGDNCNHLYGNINKEQTWKEIGNDAAGKMKQHNLEAIVHSKSY